MQVFFLPEPHRNFKQFFSALGQFNYIIKNFNPDVVHIHMAAQNALVQPFRLFGLKTVTTIHNEFDRSVRLMGFASRIVCVSKRGAGGHAQSRVSTVENSRRGQRAYQFAASAADV